MKPGDIVTFNAELFPGSDPEHVMLVVRRLTRHEVDWDPRETFLVLSPRRGIMRCRESLLAKVPG